MPTPSFSVDPGDGGGLFVFAEVSGLPVAVPSAPAGLRRVHNVTLKRGTGPLRSSFLRQVTGIAVHPRTVTIRLVDRAGAPRMTWTLGNAWPTKLVSGSVVAGASEMAIETLELACDTLLQVPST